MPAPKKEPVSQTGALLNPFTTAYRPENAYWMANFARLAYEKNGGGAPDEAKILTELKASDTKFVSVKGFNKNSSEGIVIGHSDYIVAAFRGTDEIADWLDNANVVAVNKLLGKVHSGFQNALDDVWPKMQTTIREVRKAAGSKLPLWITGHSLGGAMAMLAAASLIEVDETFYGAYTFGQPRCGDRDFCRTLNSEAAKRVFRFQNNMDIVTRVPMRVLGYSHAGSYVYITDDKKLCRDPGWWFKFLDAAQGAAGDVTSKGIGAVKDHAIDKYIAAIDAWGDRMPED